MFNLNLFLQHNIYSFLVIFFCLNIIFEYGFGIQ